MSSEKTHELFELMSIKRILDAYKGGQYYTALNNYVDNRIIELLGLTKSGS